MKILAIYVHVISSVVKLSYCPSKGTLRKILLYYVIFIDFFSMSTFFFVTPIKCYPEMPCLISNFSLSVIFSMVICDLQCYYDLRLAEGSDDGWHFFSSVFLIKVYREFCHSSKETSPTSIHEDGVISLASRSGLRIQHCCEL